MRTYTSLYCLLGSLLLLLSQNGYGQAVSIDRGVKAADLWCFPLTTDSLTYLYLPQDAHLALDEEKHPQFSLVRYVLDALAETGSVQSVQTARGGAVLHFLVQYDTPAEKVARCEATLKQLLKNDEVKVRGPVIFEEGRYALVSSILKQGKEQAEKQVLATGLAPVLEGTSLALSFELNPEASTLLLESFRSQTPEISLIFDLTFAGLTDAYQAELEIDWSEVRKHEAFQAGGSVYFVSADVEAQFDNLRRDNAIRLRTSGTDANAESLLNTAYGKLSELLFQPVSPEQVPESQRGSLTDAIAALAGSASGSLGSRNTTGFGLHVGYRLKELKTEGTSKLHFNSRLPVRRHHYITFNIGNLYARYGTNSRFFRTVALDDPDFQQRVVHVGVDGSLMNDFDKMVNSVTVTLRKNHGSGQQTLRELIVTRRTFLDSTGTLRMAYGSRSDTNRLEWLGYEYRTNWQFQRGGNYVTPWAIGTASMINLFAPYEWRVVQVMGDPALLKGQKIRSVVVKLDYDFFGEKRSHQMVLKPEEWMEDKQFQITLPLNQDQYGYTLTWIRENGAPLQFKNKDSSGVIVVDHLPENALPPASN